MELFIRRAGLWPNYHKVRAAARMVFARLAFAVETVSVALAFFGILTFFVVRADWLGTAHEWGLFWTHYAAAAPAARGPVNLALAGVLALLSVAVASIRWTGAQVLWREIAAGSLNENALPAVPAHQRHPGDRSTMPSKDQP